MKKYIGRNREITEMECDICMSKLNVKYIDQKTGQLLCSQCLSIENQELDQDEYNLDPLELYLQKIEQSKDDQDNSYLSRLIERNK